MAHGILSTWLDKTNPKGGRLGDPLPFGAVVS